MKDYYNDDGQVVKDFEEILYREDDLTVTHDEDIIDENTLKSIFEKLALQCQSQLRKDQDVFDRQEFGNSPDLIEAEVHNYGHNFRDKSQSSPDQISFIYE